MDVDVSQFKRWAAERAVEFVESGMVVGLGHGSTAVFAVRRIAELVKNGQLRGVLGVPCSLQVEEEARGLGIPLTTLDEYPVFDLTIDGADEVDPHLNLIKGGGGALLREKIVAQANRREIIVVDESKLSPALGTRWPVPVEVVPFGWPRRPRTRIPGRAASLAPEQRRYTLQDRPGQPDPGLPFWPNLSAGPTGGSAERTRWHRGTRIVPGIGDGRHRRHQPGDSSYQARSEGGRTRWS